MPIYSLLRPALFSLDPEKAHGLTKKLKRFWPKYKFNAVRTYPFSHNWALAHPVGLAAGFDKNGEMVEELFGLGFSFVEVGSVTAFPYQGNAKPRLARLPKANSLVNRMGLNSDGAGVVATRLHKLLEKKSYPIGVNIARTNDPIRHEVVDYVNDLCLSFECFATLPLAYIAFNLSCPNSHDAVVGELRTIEKLLTEVQDRNYRNIPIMLKLSPDSSLQFLSDLMHMIEHKNFDVAGFICGNTTLTAVEPSLFQNKVQITGGVSGSLVHNKNVQLTKTVRALCQAKHMIIGCGGISDGLTALDFITAGANFVQLYSAMVYKGPRTAVTVAEELASLMESRRAQVKV
jgi:dihydroorotate dehydrogenase